VAVSRCTLSPGSAHFGCKSRTILRQFFRTPVLTRMASNKIPGERRILFHWGTLRRHRIGGGGTAAKFYARKRRTEAIKAAAILGLFESDDTLFFGSLPDGGLVRRLLRKGQTLLAKQSRPSMAGSSAHCFDTSLSSFTSHSSERRIARKLGNWPRQVFVKSIASLLLDFSSLRSALVAMSVI
jgi:hypothetical protein